MWPLSSFPIVVVEMFRPQFGGEGGSPIWGILTSGWSRYWRGLEVWLLFGSLSLRLICGFWGLLKQWQLLQSRQGCPNIIPQCCLPHSYRTFSLRWSFFLGRVLVGTTGSARTPRVSSPSKKAPFASILSWLYSPRLCLQTFACITCFEFPTPIVIAGWRKGVGQQLFIFASEKGLATI